MADFDWEVKRNDTWPPITGRAQDSAGVAMPLADALQLLFLMKYPTGAQVWGTATVIDPPDAAGNNWQYAWGTADLQLAGTANAELQVKWTSTEIETVPNGPNDINPTGYFVVLIEEDLGPP